jgi:hypothetical protein
VLCGASVTWGNTMRRLFAHYIDVDYLKDALFLKAAYLDPNCGPGRLDGNTEAAAKRLVLNDLRVLVDNAREAARQDEQRRQLVRERATAEARTSAAATSTASTTASFLPELRDVPDDVNAELHRSTLFDHTGDAELKSLETMLWAAATAIRHGSKIDSIGFYVNGEGSKLSVARELALRVLVVPAGEASSERVFSAAGWFDAARRRFAPRTLCALTFCKINNV